MIEPYSCLNFSTGSENLSKMDNTSFVLELTGVQIIQVLFANTLDIGSKFDDRSGQISMYKTKFMYSLL